MYTYISVCVHVVNFIGGRWIKSFQRPNVLHGAMRISRPFFHHSRVPAEVMTAG